MFRRDGWYTFEQICIMVRIEFNDARFRTLKSWCWWCRTGRWGGWWCASWPGSCWGLIWGVRSVWSSASVQTTFKSEAQNVKLLLPCEFSEHKYIPHLRMESICPLRNRWGWRHLGLRARRGCCCVLEDAEGKELILTTLSPEDQESVGCWIAWGLISFSFSLHSRLQSQETLSQCLPSVFACANGPLQVPFTSVWGIRNQHKRKSRGNRALF